VPDQGGPDRFFLPAKASVGHLELAFFVPTRLVAILNIQECRICVVIGLLMCNKHTTQASS
jgi:hypothetical protein